MYSRPDDDLPSRMPPPSFLDQIAFGVVDGCELVVRTARLASFDIIVATFVVLDVRRELIYIGLGHSHHGWDRINDMLPNPVDHIKGWNAQLV